MNFRPFPAPQQEMLKKGGFSPEDLLDALSRDMKDRLDELSDRLADILRDVLKDVLRKRLDSKCPRQGSGDKSLRTGAGRRDRGSDSDVPLRAGQVIGSLVEKVADSLLDRGVPGGPLLAPDLVEKAVDKALKDLEESGEIPKDVSDSIRSVADTISRRLRERLGDIAGSVIRNVDVTELTDEEFRKLMEKISEMDLKQRGAGTEAGGGVLSQLWAKLLMDPRTRAYIRSRVRELRTASYFREMRWPKGKRLEPRETFRKYFRTGMPFPPVYRNVLIRPRTREDLVFFADVSGSMSAVYPVIYSMMKALEDIGLNVRMYVGDTVVEYVHDVDKVLAEVGGGGTLMGEGVKRILSELGSTLRDTTFVVYTDLEFFEDDMREFIDALERVRNTGSNVFVWVYDCDHARESVNELKSRGMYVVCDVRTLKDMLDALREMRHDLLR